MSPTHPPSETPPSETPPEELSPEEPCLADPARRPGTAGPAAPPGPDRPAREPCRTPRGSETDRPPARAGDAAAVELSEAGHRALSHSTRRELLARVTREPATISALAAALDVGKGTVAHHLGVLRSADMVTVTETRQARGGTQHLYSAAPPVAAVPSAAPGHRAAPPLPDAGAQPTAQPLLVLHDLALTEAEVAALRRCLRRVVADAVSEATRPRAGATAGRSVHTVAVDLRRSSADA